MERTPIKIEFKPAVKLSNPIQIKIDVDQSRTFRIPQQVKVAVEPFDLFWLEDESTLSLVETFSDPANPINQLEYKEIGKNVYELDPRVDGQYPFVELEVRYQNKDNTALDLGFGQYYLSIKPPSNLVTIQNNITVLVSPSGRLNLELLPSVGSIPYGRYEVRYYHKDNSIKPVQTQYWIIPYKRFSTNYKIKVPSPAYNPIPLPPSYSTILDIGYPLAGLQWEEGWDFFQFFENNSPPEGEEIDLSLGQAYTLEDIVELEYYHAVSRYFSY